MSEPLTADDYESWVGALFQSSDFRRVVLVSDGVSGGLFAVGYAVATAGSLPYLTRPEGYLTDTAPALRGVWAPRHRSPPAPGSTSSRTFHHVAP